MKELSRLESHVLVNVYVHTLCACTLTMTTSITCADFPMSWEIVCNVIFGLTISYLSLQVGCHDSAWLSCAYFCLLEDCWCNRNYITTNHLLEMLSGMAVGTPGLDVRLVCLVYFLSSRGHSGVVKYFMEHLSATWCDDNGWTLLHHACRWVSFPRVCPS